MNDQQKRTQTAIAKLKTRINKALERGLDRTRRLLVTEVKKVLSVPAPRKLVHPKDGSPAYYRALTPATAGAPPRRLSGDLVKSVDSRREGLKAFITAPAKSKRRGKSPGGFPYGKWHEIKDLGKRSGEHPFMMPTYQRLKLQIKALIGKEVRATVKGG